MNNTDQIIQILEETLSNLKKERLKSKKETTEHQELAILMNEIKEDVTKIKEAII